MATKVDTDYTPDCNPDLTNPERGMYSSNLGTNRLTKCATHGCIEPSRKSG